MGQGVDRYADCRTSRGWRKAEQSLLGYIPGASALSVVGDEVRKLKDRAESAKYKEDVVYLLDRKTISIRISCRLLNRYPSCSRNGGYWQRTIRGRRRDTHLPQLA